MRRLTLSLLIPLIVILDLSIVPTLSVLGAPLSLSALTVAALSLLGFLPEAFLVAVVAGALLDLLTAVPIGTFLIPFLLLILFFVFASRYRLLLPQAVVVTVVMAGVGLIMSIDNFFYSFDFLLLASAVFSSALLGTLIFPIIRKLFYRRESVLI